MPKRRKEDHHSTRCNHSSNRHFTPLYIFSIQHSGYFMFKLQDMKLLCSLICFTIQYIKHNFRFSRRVAKDDMHRNNFSGQKNISAAQVRMGYLIYSSWPVVVLLDTGTLWTSHLLHKLQKGYVQTEAASLFLSLFFSDK